MPSAVSRLTNCAALSCRTQRRVADMCSRTVSDTAKRLRKTRKKKSSAVLLFSERSPLSDFRQIRNKGNGIHKGGNLGVHPCAHRRGYGKPPSQVLALTPAPQDTTVKTCRKNWLSTLSTGLSTGHLGITLCIKWITFCIHPRRPPYISVFRLRIVISAVEKPPLHNPPHLVENL